MTFDWGDLVNTASNIYDKQNDRKLAEIKASASAREAAAAKANLEAQTKSLALANNAQIQNRQDRQDNNYKMVEYGVGGIVVLSLIFVFLKR